MICVPITSYAASPREVYAHVTKQNRELGRDVDDIFADPQEKLWTCYMSLKRIGNGHLLGSILRPPEWAKYTAWSGMNKWSKKAKRQGLSPEQCLSVVDNFKPTPVRKTPTVKVTKVMTPLQSGFIEHDASIREKIQKILQKNGYYKASIDGLYGNGTARALRAFNKEFLNNSDLSVQANVESLYAEILKPTPVLEKHVPEEIEVAKRTPQEDDAELSITNVIEHPVVREVRPELNIEEMMAAYKANQYLEANSMAQQLAANGDATAQYYLGLMYSYGHGALQISKSATCGSI